MRRISVFSIEALEFLNASNILNFWLTRVRRLCVIKTDPLRSKLKPAQFPLEPLVDLSEVRYLHPSQIATKGVYLGGYNLYKLYLS